MPPGPWVQVLAFVNAYLLQSEDNELAVWGVAAGARWVKMPCLLPSGRKILP